MLAALGLQAVINWNVSPDIFTVFGRPIRWYSLLFAMTFFLGLQLMQWIYKKEGKEKDQEEIDALFIYVLVATIVGARLGHCLFYEWDLYKNDLLSILKVWEGGLASHGGAAGIFLALYLFVRKFPKISYIWLVDRLALATAMGSCFIRLGNFFNSEIIGQPTDKPWGVLFQRATYGGLNDVPRHPTQLYESFSYAIIFIVLITLYKKFGTQIKTGLLTGLFLVSLFTVRFFLEFTKTPQAAYYNKETMPINVGQMLSIPFIIVGLILLFYKFKKKEVNE
ncbi:MAG: prolipoprotein diacylglyceryl transferase [Lentisphaeraceae bacterium]|nr:prolipoprotein diacylglyceryl transferase [Lentisphaeraceae bacterium]